MAKALPPIRTQILSYLHDHPEGVDDDELAAALQLKYRQQANARCRELAARGLIARRQINGKIHNFPIRNEQPESARDLSAEQERDDNHEWFWEGNVQEAVVRFLKQQNYTIASTANTSTKERGKDIVAYQGESPLWITVKGYPKGTARTRPSLQAGHWFKQAIFDIIKYRIENSEAELGLALPDYPRYRNMVEQIKWFQQVVNFNYFWVDSSAKVEVEVP
jgi:hypothetical protein